MAAVVLTDTEIGAPAVFSGGGDSGCDALTLSATHNHTITYTVTPRPLVHAEKEAMKLFPSLAHVTVTPFALYLATWPGTMTFGGVTVRQAARLNLPPNSSCTQAQWLTWCCCTLCSVDQLHKLATGD